MRAKRTRDRRPEPAIEYTDKPISGWGGLVAIARFWDELGLREVLAMALPDGRTSPNQVSVIDQILQLMVTVLIGGSRFEHVERVRADEVLKQIFRTKRFGSASSLTRYLGNFAQSQTEHLQQVLNRMLLGLVPQLRGSDVLDLDSTVFTRYGDQEGSIKGYNPHRRGARSHHPLLAMFAKLKIIAHAWLRAGSASPRRGCKEFMVELLAQLPEGFRIEAVRGDAGFYSRDFLGFLEEKALPYAIRVQMSRGFKSWCSRLGNWCHFAEDVEITEGMYASPKEGNPRRMIVIRNAVRRESEGVLFEIIDYEYWAVVTTLDGDAAQIWNFYNQRGDSENRIKELKHSFNAGGFCLRRFTGTQAAFQLICFTFNLVALFKKIVLRDSRLTLATIRTKIFVIGASAGACGRKPILRLGLTGTWKTRFAELIQRIEDWTSSTAAQLSRPLDSCGFEAPSVWRIRRNPMRALIPN